MKRIALKIEKSKEKISPFGGSVLIFELLKNLGLIEKIDKYLPKKACNRGYKPYVKILSMIVNFILGGVHISDIDKLGGDEVIKELLKEKKLPHSTTLCRYLNGRASSEERKAKCKEIEILEELLEEVSLKGLLNEGVKVVTLDQDATLIKCEKEESEKTYKGFKGFSSLLITIGEIGYCMREEFRKGNVSAREGLLSQLKEVSERLRNKGIKVLNYRGDSASYNHKIINYCEERGIEWYIGGVLDSSIISSIECIGEDEWVEYRDKYGVKSDKEEIAEFVHSMEKSEKSFRMLVVRKIKGKTVCKEKIREGLFVRDVEYEYRVIATNSSKELNEAINFYNKRGECEYNIKEAKYGFNLKNLPCGSLIGNGLWFKIGMLSYNIMIYFKRLILGKGYKRKSAKSIRYKILMIGCKIVKRGGEKILKLSCPRELIEKFIRWRRLCASV